MLPLEKVPIFNQIVVFRQYYPEMLNKYQSNVSMPAGITITHEHKNHNCYNESCWLAYMVLTIDSLEKYPTMNMKPNKFSTLLSWYFIYYEYEYTYNMTSPSSCILCQLSLSHLFLIIHLEKKFSHKNGWHWLT